VSEVDVIFNNPIDRESVMLQKLTVIDRKNTEMSSSDRSEARIDCSDYERLKLLERSHQIVVIMKPLIHQIVAAEAANNITLLAELEQQLSFERDYLIKISRTVLFTIDPTTTSE
jgi:hypothetical protein